MESIIIFVLIAIASSIFQAASQNGKQQKKATPNTQAVKTKVQPVVKTMSRQNKSDTAVASKQMVLPVQKPDAQYSDSVLDAGIYTEGIQNEASGAMELPEKKAEVDNFTSNTLLEGFSLNELQRSIIMSEVLGKPKSLQRTSR